ncbi:hypothetical protein [Legionella bononiensis]|uniref:WipA-like phosphatase domain-containing protein n=1 Tax=Legionella bononiensis TaxID=2793102 RepID=A0ABS1WDC3_9GAMM|nr:hypothetical protein [Legionella bononiensis]MBL7527351.1 hypothetical protein [Legionella bononiensis]
MPKNTKNLVSQDVSKLLTLPGSYTKPKPNTSFSVGDTHGNAIVLIRYLYEAGIINIDQEQYNELIKIYDVDSVSKLSQLTRNQCDQFRQIIIKGFADAQVPEGIHLRCFGDMFADRGSNDILSLIILDELRKNFPEQRGTILISNHDKSLLSNYLSGNLRPGQKLNLEVQPCSSLIRLKHLIDNNIISYAEFDAMMKTAYLPALKFVDYVRTEEGGIDIMAHAPITFDIIDKAMHQLLPSDQHLDIYASVDHVALILDKLNTVFVTGLSEPTSTLFKALTSKPSSSNPINGFIWTRLEEIKKSPPVAMPKYKVRFRHGHDGEPGETIIHDISYIGYNSILGKTTPQQWGHAAVAHLTMSYIESNTQTQNQAFNEVIATHMDPTIIIDEDAEASIEIEPHEKSSPSSSTVVSEHIDEKELISFQSVATLRLNAYIKARGSYTDTETGDKLWTAIADGRNMVRGLFGAQLKDVPQVPLAKQLKQTINAMTASNIETMWPEIKEGLDTLVTQLPKSKEYTSVITTIVQDFNNSALNEALAKTKHTL